MDPESFVLYLLFPFLVLLIMVARLARIARGVRAPASHPIAAVCACDHSYGTHTDEGCQWSSAERVKVRDQSTYTTNGFGDRILVQADVEWASVEKRCACRRYTGPVPLETIWTPPSIGGM